MDHVGVFCKESSIHGISQLCDKKSHLIEKLFWFLTVMVSIVCCGILIMKIGSKLSEESLITYISDTSISCKDVKGF